MISEMIRKRIAEQALCGTGWRYDWQQILQKKKLTLAFIGGSVTQGYANGDVYKEPYPMLVKQALEEQGTEVEEWICAAPGMNCMVGTLLCDDFILAKKPDLVFVEFAINETTLRPSVHAFESLLRKLVTADPAPAVCIVVLRNMSGYSCETYMAPIADYYGLPAIVLRKGLDPVLEEGTLRWTDYADEESHPNPDGHRLIADCVLHLLDEAKKAEEPADLPIPAPWLGAPFLKMRYFTPEMLPGVQTDSPIVRKDNWAFPHAFRIHPETGDWTLTLTAESLVLYYEIHSLPEYGDCEILLDGKPMKQPILHGNSIYGWGNIFHCTVFTAQEPETHTVTLRPVDGAFFITGAGICGFVPSENPTASEGKSS